MSESEAEISVGKVREMNLENYSVLTEYMALNQIYAAKIRKPFAPQVPLTVTQRSPRTQYLKAVQQIKEEAMQAARLKCKQEIKVYCNKFWREYNCLIRRRLAETQTAERLLQAQPSKERELEENRQLQLVLKNELREVQEKWKQEVLLE